MSLIVSKFGGTSVGSAEAIKRVREIVLEKPERQVVVVSAVSGVTDLLLKAGEMAKNNGDWMKVLEEINQKHKNILRELNLELDLSLYFSDLESILSHVSTVKELTPRDRDYILSLGERLSSKIITKYLSVDARVMRINARHIIKTDNNFSDAKVDWKKTEKAVNKLLSSKLNDYDKIIITGFIGSNSKGEYTTFSRGGSDYSASILASVLGAQELEIWTDVDGILTADPRLISRAKIVKNISYVEAAELSYFGAKVLHPKTIKPVIEKEIPVRVCNTFNYRNPGTLITKNSPSGIKSISRKNNIYIINLYSAEMVESCGFLKKIFSIFSEYKIVADVVSTGEAGVSVSVDKAPQEEFIKELSKCAEVEIMSQKTIICIVGKDLNKQKEIPSCLEKVIKKYGVKMISQNAFSRNMTIVVEEEESEEIIKLIYKKIFNIF